MDGDILTADGPETRNMSCKQDKDLGLSYKIFSILYKKKHAKFIFMQEETCKVGKELQK